MIRKDCVLHGDGYPLQTPEVENPGELGVREDSRLHKWEGTWIPTCACSMCFGVSVVYFCW